MTTANQNYQQKTERLTDAFRIFNELSENLTQSYQGLQAQVAHLNRQLTAARNERIVTLVEKEKLANRLQQILTALPAAVVVLNAEGYIVDCNERAISVLGEPLAGQRWQVVADRSLQAVEESPHEWRLRGGGIVSITRNSFSAEGEQIILLSDVSELRTLQDALAEQKHLSTMGEMVASLAHQIRTPLATAILYSSQLINPSVNAHKRRQFSGKILERLQYLERQVNDMLIFAKQGRMAMQGFSWHGLMNYLADSMEQFNCAFMLSNRVSDDIVLGNEDALRGALLNILINAVESGADLINLAANQSDLGIEIKVKDNGPGLDEVSQNCLFEPFYTTKTHGTGLGLAVVDSVVKAHKGRVICESSLGQGCLFTLYLPIMQNRLGLSSIGSVHAISERDYEIV
ncbi:sensor histidine kinase [Methylomonas sp. MgM2]